MYAISQMLTETTIDSVRNFVRQAKHDSYALDNAKHDIESLLEQIGFSSFLSRVRIITFSPPRTRSKPPSLEAFYHFSGILNKFLYGPPLKRVSMGLTVRRKTAKNLAVRRKNERILAVSRKKNLKN